MDLNNWLHTYITALLHLFRLKLSSSGIWAYKETTTYWALTLCLPPSVTCTSPWSGHIIWWSDSCSLDNSIWFTWMLWLTHSYDFVCRTGLIQYNYIPFEITISTLPFRRWSPCLRTTKQRQVNRLHYIPPTLIILLNIMMMLHNPLPPGHLIDIPPSASSLPDWPTQHGHFPVARQKSGWCHTAKQDQEHESQLQAEPAPVMSHFATCTKSTSSPPCLCVCCGWRTNDIHYSL